MNNNFVIFGLTRPGIKPESTVSVTDAQSNRSLINLIKLLKESNQGFLNLNGETQKIRRDLSKQHKLSNTQIFNSLTVTNDCKFTYTGFFLFAQRLPTDYRESINRSKSLNKENKNTKQAKRF